MNPIPSAGKKTRILILGGGFGGVYTALELDRLNDPSLEVTLITQENFFFLFTPMLHEVAASDLDLTSIVVPIRKLLRLVRTFVGEVQSVDLTARRVTVTHGYSWHAHALEYDHLVLGLGSVTNFFGLPGLAERAICMKTLQDAINLRNQIIAHLEEADTECATNDRAPLLTYVVAGGGFAGVETIGSINDFIHDALPHYPNLRHKMVRVVLVHPGELVLPELGPALGRYAGQQLRSRGVEIHANTKVTGVTAREVTLSDGTVVPTCTLVWTAGTSPCPTLNRIDLPKERGKIAVTPAMQVPGHPEIWALGDCALIPDVDQPGVFHPPTAQHASREGKVLARNLAAVVHGREPKAFRFKTLGLLAAIGHRTGVARIMGVNFSGFVAWWLWRSIYLSKLPGFEKKVRVALEWSLDLFFKKDFVLYQRVQSSRQLLPEGTAALPVREACDPAAPVEP